MKPPGIALGMNDRGLVMAVTRPTHAQDKVWEAVEAWLNAGGSPEQLRQELAEAWEHLAKERAEHAVEVLRPERRR